MVKVCDAVMSTGKSSAAITYMNEHKDQKFIYITPYLDEAERIKNGCPDLRFVEPSNKLSEFGFRKTDHAAYLIHNGYNLTTTHQAFKWYTDEVLEDIRRQEYTLIIDENVDVLERFDYSPGDLRMAINAGYVSENNGVYTIADDSYSGVVLRDMFRLMKTRKLIRIDPPHDNGDGCDIETAYYWVLPPELVTSFKEVFVLTYLFQGQSIHHFFEINHIPYEYIGIDHSDGSYRFGPAPGYVPEYIKDIKNRVHICDKKSLNAIGDRRTALSMNWFVKNTAGVEQLKKNVYNYFRNICADSTSRERLWGTFVSHASKLRGKGFSNAYLAFNTRATNKYKDRDCLVYAANVFMNTNEKLFYIREGVAVDEDMYALSIMIQWLWRSAIRDGKDIDIYIPSKRMRELLINWMDSISNGGNGSRG